MQFVKIVLWLGSRYRREKAASLPTFSSEKNETAGEDFGIYSFLCGFNLSMYRWK